MMNRAKSIKTKSTAGMLVLIIIAILIIINLISINLFSRIDMTDNHIYSLSQTSRELAGDLTDRLNVKAYITDDLPSPHNNDARYLKDILDDYKAYSHGYLHYEFIDPVKADKEKEVMAYRIPPLQFNVFKNDKTEFIKGYKGVVLLYGDRQEIIPFIENTDNLEYDISRAIKRLSSREIPTVGISTGHGEPDMSKGLQWANQLLQKEYRVQTVDLKNLRSIRPEINVLLIISPKEPFNEWEQYLIDQFLMSGGRVAFLLDKFNINIPKGEIAEINTGLDSLLGFYGIGIKNSLVIDLQCSMVPVMRDMGGFQMQTIVKYPFYLTISDFNRQIPIIKDFQSMNMIYISPLDFSSPMPIGRNREPLFKSSDKSGVISPPIDISPEKQYVRTDFNQPAQTLGAILSGNMISYFRDRTAPAYSGTDTSTTFHLQTKIDSSSDARIVVIGNGSFVNDDNRRNEVAYALLLNITDWLAQDKGLIGIRSKQVGARILKDTSDGTKKVTKYINMFAMPLVVIIFGLVRWQFRRSLKRREGV